ncbi:anti-sigma factor family protein [Planctomycetota bacterium]
MTTCESTARAMHHVVDGEATDEEVRAVESHCQTCAVCAQAYSELRALRTLLAESLPRPLSPEFVARIDADLDRERNRELYWHEAARFSRRIMRIAAALVVVTGLAAGALESGLLGSNGSSAPEALLATSTPAIGSAEEVLDSDVEITADIIAELAFAAPE